jgi:hypothetical protein
VARCSSDRIVDLDKAGTACKDPDLQVVINQVLGLQVPLAEAAGIILTQQAACLSTAGTPAKKRIGKAKLVIVC